MLSINTKAPDFAIPDQDGGIVHLSDYAGKWLVLYFYPKDNTSGCTTEALNFTAALDDFRALGADIVGVSPDSPASHCRFIDKNGLKFRLLSDGEQVMLKDYGVWQLKKMYGKEYHGVVRSTYIIDPDGIIRAGWEKVRVKGHVEAVLNTLQELQNG
ncbi:MAG TPA: peroxiredoxin [bacterium]|nr:peroxiredoxin [bacterium]